MVDVPPGGSISKEPVTLCLSDVSSFPKVLSLFILHKQHTNDVLQNVVVLSAFNMLGQ